MAHDQTRPSWTRKALLRALLLALFVNLLLAVLLGTQYFGQTLASVSALGRLFAGLALISSLATLLLVSWLPLFAMGALWPRRALLGGLLVSIATLAQLLLFIDTRIWGIFRYHINGMVWNVLTTPGGMETFELDARLLAEVAAGTVALLVLEWLLWFRLLVPKLPRGAPRPGLWGRPARVGVLLVLSVVLAEKLMYAVADARHDREISALARLYPLYQRLTAKRLIERVLGVKLTRRAMVEVSGPGLLLHYPLEAPRYLPGQEQRPNVLFVVVDSLRADALVESVMPNAWRWTETLARRFEDHASGGNATRFGVFSLLYGIHGSYWPSIYAERTPPVLITELQRLNYDLRVISTPRMDYPEFRSTAWVTMLEQVDDLMPGESKWQRDELVAKRFEDWLIQRKTQADQRPFFGFLMLDAPHQAYDWPRERTVFEPYAERLDYVQLASAPPAAEIERIHNSFRNAVHHSDEVFQSVLDALARQGASANTVVVLTGDHGEEFFEHGMYGHTGNFTRTQVQVAFGMSGPGIPHGVETRPTCHIDLPVTILELLGADPACRANWAQGENLLAPLEQRERVVAGWQTVALWVEGGILYVPLEGHRGMLEPMTWNWTLHPEGEAFSARHAQAVGRLALDCRRFLR